MPIYRELTGSTGGDSNYRECRVLGSKIAVLPAFKIARPAGLVPCVRFSRLRLPSSLLKSCDDTRQAVSSLSVTHDCCPSYASPTSGVTEHQDLKAMVLGCAMARVKMW